MLRARSSLFRVAVLAALLLPLAACGKKPEDQAAGAAQALLAAVWSDNDKGFEAAVDRPAVRDDLRRQLQQVALANTLGVEGGASDAALDRMIGPWAFKLTSETGAPLPAAPSLAQTQALMKPLAKDRVCLYDLTPAQTCVLTFAKRPAGWRLVAMPTAGFTLQVPPEPAKKG